MSLSGPDSGEMDFLARSALDSIADGIVVLDTCLNVLLANDVMESLHPERLPYTGQKCYTVFHGLQGPCPGCPCPLALETGEPQSMIFEYTSGENLTRSYEISMYRLEGAEGRVTGIVEHTKDVTTIKQTERQLREEVTRRRLMVENSRDGIVITTLDGSVYESNERFAHMLGYTLDEVYQLKVFDWEVAHPRDVVLEMIATVDEAGDHFETRHMRKDGTFLDVEISANGAVYNGQKLVFNVCRDITEKKAMERQIRELAIRDPLTDVYNRRYIFERLAEMVAEYSRGEGGFCVSIIDLDHFKTVNDIHGHQAGDFALKEFAETVGPMIRPYDLLGRYGGEEFVVVSRSAGAWETAAMVERIMDTVRHKAFIFDGREIRFTFSCGIADSAEFPRETLSIEDLIGRADKRLYDAKAAGRNRCVGPVALLPGELGTSEASLRPIR
jgi:diguanylate cyclase (GGDEF)-like protein/PAS domain S-box-containing protein